MSTNDTDETTEVTTNEVTDEVLTQDDEQLRQDLKDSIANDTKSEAAETETAPNAGTAEADGTKEPEATFTKEVPSIPGNTPEEYHKNLAAAYQNSTTEAMRLKGELDKKVETPTPTVQTPVVPTTGDEVLTPEQLYIRGKQIEESDAAFVQVKEKYPALEDKSTYDKFVAESRALGAFIVQDQKRFPSPSELYEKTAVILGLSPDNSEAIGSAVKDAAGAPRTASGPAAIPPKSKVTEEHIAMNQKMYPGKSRQQIIEELEPHIN